MPRHTGRHHVRLNRVALGGRPGFSFHNTVHFLRSVNPTIPMTTDSNAHKATTVCASIANTPFRGCRPASEAPHLPLYPSGRCASELFSQFKCLFLLDFRKVLARFRQDPRKLHARFRQGRKEVFRRKIRTIVSRETIKKHGKEKENQSAALPGSPPSYSAMAGPKKRAAKVASCWSGPNTAHGRIRAEERRARSACLTAAPPQRGLRRRGRTRWARTGGRRCRRGRRGTS